MKIDFSRVMHLKFNTVNIKSIKKCNYSLEVFLTDNVNKMTQLVKPKQLIH